MTNFFKAVYNSIKRTLAVIKDIFVPGKIIIKDGKEVYPPKPIGPYVVIILIIVVYFAAKATDFSIPVLVRRMLDFKFGPFSLVKRYFPPDWSFWPEIIDPLLETIQMSFLGSFLGAVFALPAAFFASSNINKNKILLTASRLILSLFRTLPIIIYASLFTLVFGLGAVAGTIAITLFTFSIVSKMLYEKIETVDLGAFEAIQSTGASKGKSFITAVLPQILPSYYSMSLYSFEINIRYAAILGYVGAGGIGFDLDNVMKNIRLNDRVVVILFFILIVVVLIESLSRFLRGRLG